MRSAIVTGAGSGIGAAAARLLAAKGLATVLVGRRQGPLDAVAEEIRSAGGRALVLPADLADPAIPAALVAGAVEAFGGLDVVVNNAAVIRNGPFDAFTQADFDLHMAVNVRAPFLLVQAALPALRDGSSPAVVNVSSAAGSTVQAGTTVYAVSKAALEHLTRMAAYELAGYGIRVNCIAPGAVETPIHATYADDVEAAYAEQARRTPLGRMAAPEEVARWIAWLCAPETEWTTGAVIPVDGGAVLGVPEPAGG